jgi:GAF domain-containing protein
MIENQISSDLLRLIQELAHLFGKSGEHDNQLSLACEKIGEHLSLSRCLLFVLSDNNQAIEVAGQYADNELPKLTTHKYAFSQSTRLYQLLSQGKPLVLSEIPENHLEASYLDHLLAHIGPSESEKVIVVPLYLQDKLIGTLCMQEPVSQRGVRAELRQAGESLAQIIALAIARDQARTTLKADQQIQNTPNKLLAPEQQLAKHEQMVSSLSRQLAWERTARQIICRLHATVDKDAVLQAAVDCLGQVLSVSHCLIVRTEGSISPLVTHEYAEGDSSPLGLGRTSQFPTSAISCFKHKTMAIGELTGQMKPIELSREDLEHLSESGIHSMLGTPIGEDGAHGLIIVLFSNRARKWSNLEIELLETVANQCAVALKHAETYAQLKDQLFKMDVIGNLTQQLTNALELAAHSNKGTGELEAKRHDPPAQLSQREMEVLKLIAQGLANREIAQRLFLTESTVELHASRIRKKLKLKSRTALVKYAYDYHLV